MVEQSQTQTDSFRAELDRKFRLPLIAYFMRRVGARHEAEDLAQEVFVKVLRNAPTIDEEKASAYIFTAAANILRDRAKTEKIRRTNSHGRLDDPELMKSSALIEDISPERVLASRQTLQEVLAALDGLSQRTRDIFVLYRIERMKQHEIAAHFGVTSSAVEKHIAKAVSHLSERFGPR